MTVSLVNSAVQLFGVVNSANAGVLSFNAGADADLLVAVVGWANSSDPPPTCIYNGHVMQLVASPVSTEVGIGAGAAAVYSLPLDSATGADGAPHNLVVQCVPFFAGNTAVYVCAYKGTNQRLGQIVPALYGDHLGGVATGTTNFTGIAAGSMVAFAGFTFFGNEPADLAQGAGWTSRGSGVAADQSAFAYTANSTAGGAYSVTLTSATPIFFVLVAIGYEVPIAGTVIAQPDVTLNAIAVARLGTPGLDPAMMNFDVAGGDILVVCIQRSNSAVNTITGAQVGPATYGGRELRFHPAFTDRDTFVGSVVDVAIMMNPPTGAQQFIMQGYQGNVGFINGTILSLSGASGVVGQRVILHNQQNGGNNVGLSPTKAGGRVIAFVGGPHSFNAMTPNYGWETIGHIEEPSQLGTWIFSGIGGPSTTLIVTPAGFSSFSIVVLEFQPDLAVTPASIGNGAVLERRVLQAGTGTYVDVLPPTGQVFHAYHETWLDIPPKADALLEPDDFYLANLPSYIDTVMLSFAVPQCTYVDMSSDLKATTGLNFPGSPNLLKRTLDLLRSRNPQTKVMLAVQQNTPEVAHNEPYDPGGWMGVTSDHLAAFNRFIVDMGFVGIVLDYEVVSGPEHEDLSFHCQTIDGLRVCYTDAEQIATIKRFRAGIARPLLLYLDVVHVGVYGEGHYVHAPPDLGWSTGYNLAMSRDAEAVACLDALHLMTYDAGGGYDARQASRAALEYFPGTPCFLGVRVGPADFAGVKVTAADFRDFANTTIKLGMAGSHMYSTMWDVAYPFRNNPMWDPPFGDYSLTFPDCNIAGAVFAKAYGKTQAGTPHLSNRKLSGGVVPIRGATI